MSNNRYALLILYDQPHQAVPHLRFLNPFLEAELTLKYPQLFRWVMEHVYAVDNFQADVLIPEQAGLLKGVTQIQANPLMFGVLPP